MSFTRRTFLVGAGAGLSVLALAACTPPKPVPTAKPTPEPDLAPAPSTLWRSRWSSDPYALGAVSFLPVGSSPDDRTALRTPLLGRVFFAGEAISDNPGTISGATQSGAQAARDVNDVLVEGERVAVVGAGAAGAEAARLLRILGAEVIVVEARDRTGGRIDSRTTADGTAFELGAWQLATDRDAAVIADLERLDIGTVALAGDMALAADDELTTGSLDEVSVAEAELGARLSTWAAQQVDDPGVAGALDASGASAGNPAVGDIPAAALDGLFAEAVRLATGAEPTDVSLWFPPAAIGAATVLPTGKLSALVEPSFEGMRLALSTAVVAVAYDEDGVSLRLGTGESIPVDRVVVTVPLAVLKSGAIQFDPPLPLSMRSAINSVGVGHIELVRVAFDEAFWTTDAVIWSLTGTDTAISTWINLQPLTGETALLGIAAGDSAVELDGLDDGDLAEMVRGMLVPFVG
jgi:hypothetical protein